MSVALLIKSVEKETVMVPVATEVVYRNVWQRGAKALALAWIEALQFGVDVTEENRSQILEQLTKLRVWFEANDPAQLVRLDLLAHSLQGLSFEAGQTAWIG